MNALPETTAKLLAAIRSTVGTSDLDVKRVIISEDGRSGGIDYLPCKNKFTSLAIERAGLSELVQLYSFSTTRHRVAAHFRPGVYDVAGKEIRIIQ